jgi:serine/threonine protein kinase
MKHICTRCRRTSDDGNLWCQDIECPAGTLPLLFKYGNYLGNIKIVDLLRVLPGAAIYKAERNDTTYYLKVANPNPEAEQYIIHEAQKWHEITNSNLNHPAIPDWIPHDTTSSDHAGIAHFRDHSRRFVLLGFEEGDFLHDFLLDNPQPWHEHVGWFMLSLSEAIQRIQQATTTLHMNINPDNLMVVRNNAKVPQPYLLDLGMPLKPGERPLTSRLEVYQQHAQPAYTPQELVRPQELTSRADVYSIGLIMWEMLSGYPAYDQLLRNRQDVNRDILLHQIPRLKRDDLPERPRGEKNGVSGRQFDSMQRIVQRAVGTDHEPYQSVDHLRIALKNLFGPVKDKRKWTLGLVATAIVVMALIIIVLFILLLFVLAFVDI